MVPHSSRKSAAPALFLVWNVLWLPTHGQTPAQGSFYGVECFSGNGDCALVRVEFDGYVQQIGVLPTTTCTFPGGSKIFVPAGIEGLAFDSLDRLWASGDEPTGTDTEYLFQLDITSANVIACHQNLLSHSSGLLKVDDVGGMAWWDTNTHLVSTDNSSKQNVYVFDPLSLVAINLESNDPTGGCTTGLAKFPDGGDTFYASVGGAFLHQMTCAGSCMGEDDITSVEIGQFPSPSDISSLAAVPGGNLYGVDLSRTPRELVEIDPSSAAIISRTPMAASSRQLDGLAFRRTLAGEALDLRLTKTTGVDIWLAWSTSCDPSDSDYAVYEGTLDSVHGGVYDHTERICTTSGATGWTLAPAGASAYYIVVALDGSVEGSYGKNSAGVRRPVGTTACKVQQLAPCGQ